MAWIRSVGGAAALGLGLLTIGCGGYEPEPAYPGSYADEAPRPLTSEELAQQQQQVQARVQANAETREILIGGDPDDTAYTDTDPSALTEFKPALDGHGAWVEDATYGTVWVPSKDEVGGDFQPYVSAGHWTYSDEADYVWVSDYSWGWAPFHYGRWVYLPGYAWSWIPGRRYAGAWVTWRVGPAGYGYVGWAPAPPAWYWYHGAAYGWQFGGYSHHDHYVYCPREYVYHGVVGGYVVRGPAAQEHFGRTHDYVPAAPAVAGPGRVVASPTVGTDARPERTIAAPTVGNGARVAGTERRGPRPDEMGIKGDAIVAPPSAHPGLERARAIANVQPVAIRPASWGPPNPSSPDRGPATGAYVPSVGSGGSAPAPIYRSPSESPVGDRAAQSMTASRPHAVPYSSPSPSPSPSSGAYGASAYMPSRSPAFHAEARPSVPTYAPRVPSSSMFRSSPPSSVTAARSTPTFRSAAPTISSAPTFHSAAPHSVGAIRSSPAPTFHAASPSMSSPSHSVGAIRSSPSVSGRGSTVSRSKR